MQKNSLLNERITCLEAVNAEQSQQIKSEIQNLMSVVVTEQNCEFLSNAQAICDKLNFKKEVNFYALILQYFSVSSKDIFNASQFLFNKNPFKNLIIE